MLCDTTSIIADVKDIQDLGSGVFKRAQTIVHFLRDKQAYQFSKRIALICMSNRGLISSIAVNWRHNRDNKRGIRASA